MRIGVLSDFGAVNTIYRAIPVFRLTERGHDVVLDRGGEHDEHPRLFGCDVVHIYRHSSVRTRRLVRELRARGIGVTWDIDDDVQVLPQNVPGIPTRRGLDKQQLVLSVQEMAAAVDVVTTTSEPIAERYRAHGAETVRVIPNFVPEQFATGEPTRHDGVVIGWVASVEHTHDVRALALSDVVRRLLDVHPTLLVATVGVHFEALPHDRCDHRKLVQYRDLGERVAGFDIGIAPLDDIPFNRARSDVKLKEYALAGVPWLASPVGPYRAHGEKQGGRLVADGDWFEALDRLVVREKERRKLAKRALRWGRTQTMERNLEPWEAVMREAAQRAGRDV